MLFRLIMLGALLLPLSSSWGQSPPGRQELRKITFACHWLPQAQFSGYYMAVKKGFFQKYGMEVKIIHADAANSNAELLMTNRAEFVSMYLANAIRLRAEGKDLINIGQLFRHSSLMLIGKKSAGIKSVEDFNGRRIAIWRSEFRDMPMKYLERNGIHADILFLNNSVDLFLWGAADVMSATVYNEYHTLISAGIDDDQMFKIRLKDQSLDVPEDGIYCRENFLKNNPELCKNFVKAVYEGWRYALAHRDETMVEVEKIIKEAHLPFARCHQAWMLEEVGKLIFSEGVSSEDRPLSRDEYLRSAELLLSAGRIKTIPSFEIFIGAPPAVTPKRK